MHETPEDLALLQDVLDRSYADAGPHLRRIITPQRRLTAAQVCDRLTGMRLLTLATTTADGRPLAGPVDGILFRGAFHFSSAPDSMRMRHIAVRPQVSATHLPGEDLAVTVHGRATPVDVSRAGDTALRQAILGVYVPRYGPDWEAFLDSGPVYARIEAEKMFTLHLAPDG